MIGSANGWIFQQPFETSYFEPLHVFSMEPRKKKQGRNHTLGIQSPSENGNGTKIPFWGGEVIGDPQSSSDKVIGL